MPRPVVGIIGNMSLLNDQYPAHSGGTMNSCAVAQAAGCLPLIIPADPRMVTVEELLDVCDGFLLTGGRPNVHPEEYGEAATEAHGAFDRCRDAITLPLIRACVDRGQQRDWNVLCIGSAVAVTHQNLYVVDIIRANICRRLEIWSRDKRQDSC